MKKFGVVCSVVLAALLCVSGITVFALSPEEDATAEAGNVCEPETLENVIQEVLDETIQAEVNAQDQQEGAVIEEESGLAEEEEMTEPVAYVQALGYYLRADMVGPKTYYTLDELKQIKDISDPFEIVERFGVPDELVMSSGSGWYNWYKYLSSDGGYAIVCTYWPADSSPIVIESVEFSDEVAE